MLEDCQDVRPDWTPDMGQASSFAEFLLLLKTFHGYVWLACVLVLVWKRNALSAAMLALASLVILADWELTHTLDDRLWLGLQAGCVGSLTAAECIMATSFVWGTATLAWRLVQRRQKSQARPLLSSTTHLSSSC